MRKIRFVSNETQLTNILSEFGFEILAMSKLSLADQINLFRTADYIIGPHGAAFTNLAFAKPGATFIEFFSKGTTLPHSTVSAEFGSLKYGFLIGEPTTIGGFAIEPDHLKAILAQALRPT